MQGQSEGGQTAVACDADHFVPEFRTLCPQSVEDDVVEQFVDSGVQILALFVAYEHVDCVDVRTGSQQLLHEDLPQESRRSRDEDVRFCVEILDGRLRVVLVQIHFVWNDTTRLTLKCLQKIAFMNKCIELNLFSY